jgi:two-component system nitrate/nitrite response regulator NarL
MQAVSSPVRVLVIEHRAIIRAALAQLVASHDGYDVVATADRDTVSIDAALQRRPDVALLAIGDNTDRDLGFLAQLRDRTPSVRALLLTECDDRSLHQEAIRKGAYGVISPHGSPDTLIRALGCISRGEYWITRTTAAALARSSRASRGAAGAIAALTARERGILALIAEGLRNKEIASRLNISETTVRHHLTSIFDKLDVSDRLELAVHALRNGLVAGPSNRTAGRMTPCHADTAA